MANCAECGKPLPAGYKICPACGGSTARLGVEITAHINLLRKKIGQEPANSKFRMDLAAIYQTHGLNLEARDEYLQVVTADPRNFDAHFKLAQILMKLRQGEKAEKEYNAALHLNPKSTEVLTGLFRSYFLQSKIDLAIILGEKILQSDPDNVEYHILMKDLYGKKHDRERTLKELLVLSTLIPEDKQIIREITAHYIENNDFEKAAVFYGRLMNMAANDPALGIRIGEYYFDRNEYDRAIEYMVSLLNRIDLNPGMNSALRARLAMAYLNKDAAPEALKIADGVRAIDPREIKPEIRKMLGIFYSRIGHAELADKRSGKAAGHFEEAIRYDPGNAEAGQVLKTIRSDANAGRTNLIKKAGIVAAGVIVVILALVLIRTATRGRIVFQVDPPVAVTLSIDGRAVKGETGEGGALVSPVLSLGKHRVAIESEGYETWNGSVAIGFARNARQAVSLAPIYYTLRLVSRPESSDVVIDDRITGKTPFASDRVPVGRNTVAVVRENYARWCTTFTASKGDAIDLDTVILKNLTGEWAGKIGKEAYAYNASFRMTFNQAGGDLAVDYFHKPVEGYTYSGKIKGFIKQGELTVQGDLVYRYYDIFRWEKIKRKIVLKGRISDDWDRIEGNSQVDGLGDQEWWAERSK